MLTRKQLVARKLSTLQSIRDERSISLPNELLHLISDYLVFVSTCRVVSCRVVSCAAESVVTRVVCCCRFVIANSWNLSASAFDRPRWKDVDGSDAVTTGDVSGSVRVDSVAKESDGEWSRLWGVHKLSETDFPAFALRITRPPLSVLQPIAMLSIGVSRHRAGELTRTSFGFDSASFGFEAEHSNESEVWSVFDDDGQTFHAGPERMNALDTVIGIYADLQTNTLQLYIDDQRITRTDRMELRGDSNPHICTAGGLGITISDTGKSGQLATYYPVVSVLDSREFSVEVLAEWIPPPLLQPQTSPPSNNPTADNSQLLG